jgi:hypothetical protein
MKPSSSSSAVAASSSSSSLAGRQGSSSSFAGLPAAAAAAPCFESEITNTSGRTLRLSNFEGKVVLARGTFRIPGNVFDWVATQWKGIKRRRMLAHLRDQLDAGLLQVTEIPAAPCGLVLNDSSSSVWSSSSSR